MVKYSESMLADVFSILSRAAGRKKVYARMAAKRGRDELAHLLRAMAESESVQARRVFNSLRGRVDTSDHYVSTIFEHEVEQIIGVHENALQEATRENNTALQHVFSQLRAAEKRIRSFYAREKSEIKDRRHSDYFVCQFCGFINPDTAPEACPVCGAVSKEFRQVR